MRIYFTLFFSNLTFNEETKRKEVWEWSTWIQMLFHFEIGILEKMYHSKWYFYEANAILFELNI